jgi:hypothetical protein
VEPDDAHDIDDSEDPFGVRLEWPEELLGAPMDRPATDAPTASTTAVARQSPAPEETSWAPATPAPPPLGAPQPSPEAARDPEQPASAAPPSGPSPILSEESREVLAGVVARVEALTAATVTFRNLVSDRVSEYTERVIQATAAAAAEADEQRRMNDRTLADIRTGLARSNAAVERLAATVEALPSELDRVAAELGAKLERVADEVQTLRRRTAVRPRAATRGDVGEDDAPPPRRPPRKRAN